MTEQSAEQSPTAGTQAKKRSGGATLVVGWPYESAELGDVTVTREGTDVPEGDVDDLLDTADELGIPVYEKAEEED